MEPIARENRISIACVFYGLYALGLASTESERVDEDCCMDNMRVPFYKDQLSENQKLYLKNPSAYWNKRLEHLGIA